MILEDTPDVCFSCGAIINGWFASDYFGNKIHHEHKDISQCVSCGKFIHPRLIHQEKVIEEGRFSCGECHAKAVLSKDDIREPYIEVLRFFKTFEIEFKPTVPVHLLGQKKFKEIYPRGLKAGAVGFANSQIRTNPLEVICNIYIVMGLHQVYFADTLTHELTHCWIKMNSKRQNLGETVEEGLCNYMGYLFLEQRDDEDSRFFMEQAMRNRDPVYGTGMRLIKKYVQKHSLETLLSEIREGKGKNDFIF